MTDFTPESLERAIEAAAEQARRQREDDRRMVPDATTRFQARLAAVRPAADRRIPAAAPRRLPWAGIRPAWTAAVAASVLVTVMLATAAGPERETLRARPGARLSATLSDGSRVELRGGSTLRVRMPASRRSWRYWWDADPAARRRLVELEGEARFEVVHDARHPFRVVASGVVVDDIGTVFGVRAYPTDTAVRIVVTEGSVAVRSARDAIASRASAGTTLTAGDIARVSDRGAIEVTHAADADDLLAWTGGQLVYRNTPLAQVLDDLQSTFGRPFVLEDSRMASQAITVTLDARRLDIALRTLATLLDLVPRQVGDTLVLTPTPHPR